MSSLMQAVIVALVPIGVINTGALIYFCGAVNSTLRDVNRRIGRLEDWREGHEPRQTLAGEGQPI